MQRFFWLLILLLIIAGLPLSMPIELKLDWIWLRNLEAVGNGIDREVKVSDHWPLWIVIRRPRFTA